MRNIFWSLVLANLAYFAWAHLVDRPRPPPVNESVARLPRLKLASELPKTAAAAPKAERTTLLEGAACISVGPFLDVENSTRAADLLRAKGFTPRPRTESGTALQDFWVYLGGMKSDADAERTLQNLQHLGFQDAELMPAGGDPGRRISLGLFHDRAGADQRIAAARLKGFNPTVSERKRSATEYWLDLDAPAGVGAPAIEETVATGVSSKIAVQPCAAIRPPHSEATRHEAAPVEPPATAAISKVP